MRHNNCVIFSVFLYFKFIHLQICTRYNIFFHQKKSYQLVIGWVAKNLPVLELLNQFIKSNTVPYKRVAYKKNLVYCLLRKSFQWKIVSYRNQSMQMQINWAVSIWHQFLLKGISEQAIEKKNNVLQFVVKCWKNT